MINDDGSLSLTTRTHWKLLFGPGDAGLRLDQALPRHCPGLSRTQARKIITIGGVHLCGRRVQSSSRLIKGGEEVAVYYDGLPLDPYSIVASDILYRDEAIIVLNKPAGIETQPTPARYQGTLYAALGHLLADPFRPQLQPTIGMIQRLDRETSGVILFSISPKAHKPLTAAITARTLHKTYLALVTGLVPAGEHEVVSLLARSHRDNCVRSVPCGGQEAVTRYRSLASSPLASLVEVTPITGRMHQIRVHLSEAGFPILGDKRYGGVLTCDGVPINRHMLHASTLDFLHPLTLCPQSIIAPLPPDFQQLLLRCQLTP